MGLEISSHGTYSPWCRELMSRYRDDMIVKSGIDALVALDVEHAYLSFDDHKRNCRPYMLLIGYPRQLEGEFPFGVSNINFINDADMAPVVYRYDMTRNNLAELARKGLYEPDFEIPPIIKGNRFILPCLASVVGMPADQPSQPPVLFASIESASLRCTDVTSGYCIDEYFRELPLSEEEEAFNNMRKESIGLTNERVLTDAVYAEVAQRSATVFDKDGMEETGFVQDDIDEPDASEQDKEVAASAAKKVDGAKFGSASSAVSFDSSSRPKTMHRVKKPQSSSAKSAQTTNMQDTPAPSVSQVEDDSEFA